MIIFAGSRDPAQPIESKQVYYWAVGFEPEPLPLYLEHCNHSPTGFEWGYGGSGPAQLAWAILYTVFSKVLNKSKVDTWADTALYYQRYKWQVIAGLPYQGWQLSSEGVLDWLQKQGYDISTSLD